MTVLEGCNPSRILIRAVNWIGDAVMTTPAIGMIRSRFPRAEITILANPLVSELFSPHPYIDRVVTFDRAGRHRGVRGRLRLAAEIRRMNFDLAIILPNSFDSALVPWLARVPVRIGKQSDGRGFMLTSRYSPVELPPLPHEIEYYCNLVRHFGISGENSGLVLQTTTEEDRAAADLLAMHGIGHDDFILGLNPGATFGAAKRWYPERFAGAAQQLADMWNARPVIFGSPAERPLADAIATHLGGRGLNLAGTTTVRHLMALIRRCNFLITNDSGPMHIAAAFGVPLVAVFGPTDHATTSPRSNTAVIVRKQTECAPCKLRECPTDHRCMTAVTADEVVAAAKQIAATCQ